MGRPPGRRVQHSVLDKPERHLRDRSARSTKSPPRVREAKAGGITTGETGANPRYPRRQGRRMVPIPGDGSRRGILGKQSHSVVPTDRPKSTKFPVHSNSNMCDNVPVSKRARLTNLPELNLELS